MTARGYEITVISLGGDPIDGVETIIYPHTGKLAYFSNFLRAVQHARALKPDILHLHAVSGFGLWSVGARISPTIASVWGSDILEFGARGWGRMLVRRMLKCARHITATSEFLKNATLEIAPGISNRLTVIPFGVTAPQKIEAFPPHSPFRLCMLKANRHIYGVETMMRAMAILKNKNIGVTVSILRAGTYEAKIREMIKEFGLAENVNLIGNLDHDKIYDFIAQHHALLMPSLSESFGVAALEAQAAGRPVIATDVGGIPEVVLDGKTGILVQPNNPQALAEAITKLATNIPLVEKMGQAGREFVQSRYVWSKSLDMMQGIYEQALNEKA